MNGDVTDWVRGTAAGKIIPEGAQTIYDPDGSFVGAMYGGKFYSPDSGALFPDGGGPKQPNQQAQDQAKASAPLGSAIGDFIFGTKGGFVPGEGVVEGLSKWVMPIAVLAVGGIILWVGLQGTVKSGER